MSTKPVIENGVNKQALIEEVYTGIKCQTYILTAGQPENVWLYEELYDEEGKTLDISSFLLPRSKYKELIEMHVPKLTKLEKGQYKKTYPNYQTLQGVIYKLKRAGKNIDFVNWHTNTLTYSDSKEAPKFEGTFGTKQAKNLVAIGVYKMPTGEIYLVTENRHKTGNYAKKLMNAPSDRLTVSGKTIKFDWSYKEAVKDNAMQIIKPEHKMSEQEMKDLMVIYKCCIRCNRTLKVAESVALMMGKRCAEVLGIPYPKIHRHKHKKSEVASTPISSIPTSEATPAPTNQTEGFNTEQAGSKSVFNQQIPLPSSNDSQLAPTNGGSN